MTFLTADYFKGDLLIPNLADDTTSGSLTTQLQMVIALREPEFLRLLMGDTLYGKFVAGYGSGVYATLRNQIYTTETVGVSPNTVTYYLSPAANYVYFFFQRTRRTLTVGTSEAEQTLQNGTIVNDVSKMVNAWNAIKPKIDQIRQFMDDHADNYPDWDRTGWLPYGYYTYPVSKNLVRDPFEVITKLGL